MNQTIILNAVCGPQSRQLSQGADVAQPETVAVRTHHLNAVTSRRTMRMLETDDNISVSLSRVTLINQQMGYLYNVFILPFVLFSLSFLHLFYLLIFLFYSLFAPCHLLSLLLSLPILFSVCSFLFTFCHSNHSTICFSLFPSLARVQLTQHQSFCVSTSMLTQCKLRVRAD